MRARFPTCFGLCVLAVIGCGGGSSSPDAPKDSGNDGPIDSASDQSGSDVAAPDDSASTDAGNSDDGGSDDGGPLAPCTDVIECPGQDSECAQRTCIDGVCGMGNQVAGKVLATQTLGDCLVRKCDGNGLAVVSADDSDVPDDQNPCTVDACLNGVASHSPQPANTACGGAKMCNASGQCVGCATADDCPGTDGDCRTRTCTQGTCGFNYKAAGTAVADPTTGDCKGSQCDGLGVAQIVDLPSDLPSDTNPCTLDQCNGGTPTFGPAARGTACGDSQVCDGQSHCAACLTAATCPGVDDDCKARTCIGGACGIAFSQSGKTVTAQTAGDCQKIVCDGQGMTTSVADDTDVAGDNNMCVSHACSGGTASTTPKPADTGCGGSLKCDGAGNCVGCTTGADCGTNTACVSFGCTDGRCVPSYGASGTVVTDPTPKDCKKAVCDGLGAVLAQPDNSDLPVDGLGCTADVCTNGSASNPPLATTATCNENGGAHCNGAGLCVACNAAADCGADSECKKFTCSAQGVCSRNDPAAGTALATQTPGDCQTATCDGNGGVTSQANDNDHPNDSNDCTGDVCTNGTPSNPALAQGTTCAGGQCDGSGHCMGCTLASDCGANTECKIWTCVSHVCGRNDPVDGTAVASQTPDDCKKVVCNGSGDTRVANDDTDNDDGNACTDDACSSGTVSHVNTAAGKVCSQNSGVMCNGVGACGPSLIVINEVQPNGSATVPDWVEVYNLSATQPVSMDGWIFKDSTTTHSYALPSGTTVGAHSYFAFDGFGTATGHFGLNKTSDSARLFDPSGNVLFDSASWTTQTTSHGRCPDVTGTFQDFTSPDTKGAANIPCP
ncbi:MAG TPA: lamin tail domain-containing protein [Polyangia bacterium]